jgi:hypothetical protein
MARGVKDAKRKWPGDWFIGQKLQLMLGGLKRNPTPGRPAKMGTGEHGGIGRMYGYGSPGRFHNFRDGANVVDVPMGEKDRFHGQLLFPNDFEDFVPIATRIDNDGFTAFGIMENVTVRSHRTNYEGFHEKIGVQFARSTEIVVARSEA